MMKIAVMQPYFLPYIGYFQLMNYVDQFVVYDDVNYINRGWINRNYILINGQKKLFTISLGKASQNKLINEIEIIDDFVKLRKTISMNYSKAKYFRQINDLLDKILVSDSRNLSTFITNSLQVINAYLGITTKIILSSTLDKNTTLKGQDKIIAICEGLEAATYINLIGGMEIYNKDIFRKHGISLRFIQSISIPYKQFRNDFVPNLSILDVLMHKSPLEIKELLYQFELV